MFLTTDDLSATLYPDIATMITGHNQTILTMQLATAEAEIEAYLSARYLIRAELDKVGEGRHRYLLSLARDLAVYHLYSLQETMPALRLKRYEQAIAMLKLIQDGKSQLPGVAPVPPPTDPQTAGGQIGWGSRPPRASLV